MAIQSVKGSDNNLKEFSEDKLRRFLSHICEGLECVDQGRLYDATVASLSDMVSTVQVYDAAILAACGFMSEDPEYDTVAARIQLRKMRREVFGKSTKWGSEDADSEYRLSLYTSLNKGVREERLSDELQSVRFQWSELYKALRPERDELFKFIGLDTLYKKYVQRDSEGRITELPQVFWMRVAMGLCYNEDDPTERAIEFYDVLSQLLAVSSTPTLLQSGTVHPQLISCFVNTVNDSLESIYKCYLDNAYLSKWSGGIGTDWSNLRATGSMVKSAGIESQGVVPFLKIENDSTVAIARSGKRKGARVAYLATWHLDIEDFLDLRKETGDERRRTHDLHTANWIPDLFMKRVAEDKDWTLFSPDDVPGLHDSYGDAFDRLYEEAETKTQTGEIKLFKVVKARDLWRKMVTRLFETGHSWMCFSTPPNILNRMRNVGPIHSSNLCTEIQISNKADDETSCCNLASLNLARLHDSPIPLRQLIRTVIRMLDNVIDINFYPIPEARKSNLRHRPIGMGTMGLQDYLWQSGFLFDSMGTRLKVHSLYEEIQYYAIEASMELAKERGSYETFPGSPWSEGELTPYSMQRLVEYRSNIGHHLERFSYGLIMDWDALATEVETHGIRNSNLTAIAPTVSIGTIAGVIGPCIEPAFSNMFVETNMKGEFIVVNSYLVEALKRINLWNERTREDIKVNNGSIQNLDYIPQYIRDLYKTAFEIDQRVLIDLAAIRVPFIDQSQSLNLFYAGNSGAELSELYQYAWRAGLKSTYYLRTVRATDNEKVTVNMNRVDSNDVVPMCRIDNPDCEACQ